MASRSNVDKLVYDYVWSKLKEDGLDDFVLFAKADLMNGPFSAEDAEAEGVDDWKGHDDAMQKISDWLEDELDPPLYVDYGSDYVTNEKPKGWDDGGYEDEEYGYTDYSQDWYEYDRHEVAKAAFGVLATEGTRRLAAFSSKKQKKGTNFMSKNTLRKQTIRLAAKNAKLRPALLKLLKTAKAGKALTAGEKVYNVKFNVGHAKYVVNTHDGKKTHKDGSPFFDIDIFKNKKDFEAYLKKLEQEGYKEESRFRKASVTKRATLLDENTLSQIVDMAVESQFDDSSLNTGEYQIDNWIQLENAAKHFSSAVFQALAAWAEKNIDAFDPDCYLFRNLRNDEDDSSPLLDPEAVASALMTAGHGKDAADFLYFMELEGAGIGTWDGDWDELFVDRSSLKELSDLMKKDPAVRAAYNKLTNEIQAAADAAYEQMTAPEELELEGEKMASASALHKKKAFKMNKKGPNVIEIEFNDGSKVLVSYDTPVAFFDAKSNSYFKTDKKHSTTTSKHVNQWIGKNEATTRPQPWFDAKLEKANAKKAFIDMDILLTKYKRGDEIEVEGKTKTVHSVGKMGGKRTVWFTDGTSADLDTLVTQKKANAAGLSAYADDLVTAVENDSDLYRQVEMIQKNLVLKMVRGVYNHALAPKLWGYIVEQAAKKMYANNKGWVAWGFDGKKAPGEGAYYPSWNKMFPPAIRLEAAKALADTFLEQIQNDEFDIHETFGVGKGREIPEEIKTLKVAKKGTKAMDTLRKQTIRLAAKNEKLRPELLKLLKTANVNWKKLPSVTVGGKAFFWSTREPDGVLKHVVWDRADKKWNAQIDHETVKQLDTPEEAKKFLENSATAKKASRAQGDQIEDHPDWKDVIEEEVRSAAEEIGDFYERNDSDRHEIGVSKGSNSAFGSGTNGGFGVDVPVDQQYFISTGKMPTHTGLTKAIHDKDDTAYTASSSAWAHDHKDFMEQNGLKEEDLNYNDLYEKGFGHEADDLDEYYRSYQEDEYVTYRVIAFYLAPGNSDNPFKGPACEAHVIAKTEEEGMMAWEKKPDSDFVLAEKTFEFKDAKDLQRKLHSVFAAAVAKA